ncbi:MAG: hypothetical protein JO157_01060 [Acetobacteraceae bacterium]|nr:hypothetical protein [Acetobacteraceae bacterium]
MLSADRIPHVRPGLAPPLIHGTAALTKRAFGGEDLDSLLASVQRPAASVEESAARLLDASCVLQLGFRREQGLRIQAKALRQCQVFRVARANAAAEPSLRLLALVAPGDLMVNTPLDFITGEVNVELTLLYVVPGFPLPAAVPDHDAAFFAVSESDPGTLDRLRPLYAAWPRPVLNDPAQVARLSRDELSRGLAGLNPICSPPTIRAGRAEVEAWASQAAPRATWDGFPVLVRPFGSHAGANLAKANTPDDLAAYLAQSTAESFYATRFVDYRGVDGLYRKYRVACVGGAPYLCHMAASEHWMVHYLNAGMADCAEKRVDEALAMAEFDVGFARRHRAGFEALDRWMGLDYYQLDCGETRDGRLLIFEADVAAIVHAMDPPDLYPYKPPQMRRVFAAFEAMLRRRAGEAPGLKLLGADAAA